jgi:hypothetical protein
MFLAPYTLNRLMRHLPESGFGLHVYDLFLQAVIAGNSHGDIRLLHLYLGHDRPPALSCNFGWSASIELPEKRESPAFAPGLLGVARAHH